MNDASSLDVLVVGAGPTGLALASQLARWGIRFRIIDKRPDRAQESRALAVQPRSLELLQSIGLGERLAARGQTTTRLVLHLDRARPATIDLGDIDRTDTRFPYILLVSQADTEAVLVDHLESCGVTIERRVELVGFQQNPNGLTCALRHEDGRDEAIRVRYLAGCDGAHSTVRKAADIPFEGSAYLQNFALGDVEANGPLVPGGVNVFALGRGLAVFFPLGHPTTWRVIAIQGRDPGATVAGGTDDFSMDPLSLPELQAMVDDPTRGAVRLRDPVWLTRFRLHHRQAARYRDGSAFLAGDAAHIHSPVGAQGMNTGIQDSWNLGWKLAMVSRGVANERNSRVVQRRTMAGRPHVASRDGSGFRRRREIRDAWIVCGGTTPPDRTPRDRASLVAAPYSCDRLSLCLAARYPIRKQPCRDGRDAEPPARTEGRRSPARRARSTRRPDADDVFTGGAPEAVHDASALRTG